MEKDLLRSVVPCFQDMVLMEDTGMVRYSIVANFGNKTWVNKED